jgi:hypothetical protein
LWFLGGLGVGYLLGTRAGRERFDQIVSTARRFWESPTVQEAAGLVQAQATKLYEQGRQVVGDTLHRDGHLDSPERSLGSGDPDEEPDEQSVWETPPNKRPPFPANSF